MITRDNKMKSIDDSINDSIDTWDLFDDKMEVIDETGNIMGLIEEGIV